LETLQIKSSAFISAASEKLYYWRI